MGYLGFALATPRSMASALSSRLAHCAGDGGVAVSKQSDLLVESYKQLLAQPPVVLETKRMKWDENTYWEFRLIKYPSLNDCIEPRWEARKVVIGHCTEWQT